MAYHSLEGSLFSARWAVFVAPRQLLLRAVNLPILCMGVLGRLHNYGYIQDSIRDSVLVARLVNCRVRRTDFRIFIHRNNGVRVAFRVRL